MLWSLTFCVKMLESVLNPLSKKRKFNDRAWYVHAFNWVVPIISSAVVLGVSDGDGFGSATLWCW
jgi:hypothetical protein